MVSARYLVPGVLVFAGGCSDVRFDLRAADGGIDVRVDAAPEASDVRLDGADDAGPDAGPPCPPPAANYCLEIPRLPARPVIDGAIECGLSLIPVPTTTWTPGGTVPTGQRSRYAVAWLPDGLYFYVEVDDPDRVPAATADPTWCGDGLEVYADADGVYAAPPDYDDPGTRQLIASAPADDTSPSTRGQIYVDMMLRGAWSGAFRSYPRPGGYLLEAFLQASDLGLTVWDLAAGGQVGIDIGVNVSHPMPQTGSCTNRLGQYFLRAAGAACPGHPYCDVAAFCTPRLLGP